MKKKNLIGILISVLAGIFKLLKSSDSNKQNPENIIPKVQFDRLTMSDLLPWYKENLTESEDVIAVLLSDKNALVKQYVSINSNSCFQGIYNTKQETLMKIRIVEYKELDETIINSFKNQDMIILK